MFFFSLALFLLVSWFFPWWSLAIPAFVLGWLDSSHSVVKIAISAFLAWASLSYVQDGANYGNLSLRLAGLFHLPWPWLVYVLMGILALITASLSFLSAGVLKTLTK